MTLLSPPASRGGPPPEDLDRRLRALFRAQLPHPWPPAPATPARPAATTPARPRVWRPLLRARLALAASVALLLTGLLFLAGAFPGRPAAPGAGPAVVGPSADHDFDPAQHPASPVVTFPSDSGGQPKIKVDESLIQEPTGTSYHVTVIDLPAVPR